MFTHPYIASQLARERQREMMAQASRRRLVRQLREHAGATQRAQRAVRRMPRVFRRIRPAALPS
jgi:hypothetical protein